MSLPGGPTPPAPAGMTRRDRHFRIGAAFVFLSSRSPRDNTMYSWNSHSSGVNKRWAAVHGGSCRIPNRNWAAVQGPIPSTINPRGGQGPPRPAGQHVAAFWRFKVAVWESIHLGLSWWTLVRSSWLPRPRQRRRFLSPGTCRARALLSEASVSHSVAGGAWTS